MTMRHPHSILLLSCLLMMSFVLGGCERAQPPAQQPPAATPDAPPSDAAPAPAQTDSEESAADAEPEFPTLKLATLDGGQYDLAAHRGKWVVVNFWATWCKPCIKEMPELSALDAMREHVEVIGLAYDDTTPADIRSFLQKRPVAYPIAIVDVYDPPKDFATPRGLPMTYLLAPDGRVAKKFLGPITAKEIEAAIAAAGGPEVPKA
jgi:thiol-disulfide isomerase/thioredoxin